MEKMSDQLRDEIVNNDKVFKEYVIDRFEDIKRGVPVCEKEIVKKELKIHLQLIILLLTTIIGLCVYVVQDTFANKTEAKEFQEAKRR